MTDRLVRHFSLIWSSELSEASMVKIFSSILRGYLEDCPKDNKPMKLWDLGKPIVEGAVEIYNEVSDKLKPTPAKCHYTFNLRDLSKVVQGILMLNIVNIDSKEIVLEI